jgi:hypothetical protein
MLNRDYRLAADWVRTVLLQADSLEVVLYAKVLAAVIYAGETHTATEPETNTTSGALLTLDSLLDLLGQIEQLSPKSEVAFELEGYACRYIALQYFRLNDYGNAKKYTLRAFQIAKLMVFPVLQERSHGLLVASLYNLGQTSSCFTEINKVFESAEYGAYNDHLRLKADALFILGNSRDAFTILESHTDDSDWAKVNLNMYELLLGTCNSEEIEQLEVDPKLLMDGFLEVLQMQQLKTLYLMQFAVSDATMRQNAKALSTLCDTTLRHPKLIKGSWFSLLALWLKALVYIKDGKSEMALQILEDVALDTTDWLVWRVLIGAARLEACFQASVEPAVARIYEQALVDTFGLARTLPGANPQGLVQVLNTWHPYVAAYCVFMPKSVPELLPVTDWVLACKNKNRVVTLEKPLPPAVATSIILESFHWVGGATLIQLNQLEIETLRAVRNKVIGVPLLLYALVKLGHNQQAKQLMEQYGVFPTSTDRRLKQLARLKSHLQQLVTRKLSLEAFEETLLEWAI